MTVSKNDIIGDVVARDYRTASVFKAYKIDFCCRGGRTIEEVCQKESIGINKLIDELENVAEQTADSNIDFNNWEADLLVDYIEKKHHRYVNRKIPELKAYLNKVARVHGERHPELLKIESLFTDAAVNLLSHMQKEEKILFPYVRGMATDGNAPAPAFGTVQNPINVMMVEHDTEGQRFREIAELSNDYTPPTDACTTYRVAFAMLKEFEDDLHRHIHLENNILFPKTVAREKELMVV